MLLQLRVENHRSIRDEVALSLAAAPALGTSDERLLHPPAIPEPVLPTLAIYGANASGKTNVLHALGFMQDAVLDSHRAWDPDGGCPVEPFALSARRNEPSLFEVDLILDGGRYRYGFVCSRDRIEEEWLHAWPAGHKQTWFEREGETFEFGGKFGGANEAIRKLTRANSLFLSAAAQNNHAQLLPIFRWFRTTQVDLTRRRSGHHIPLFWAELNSRQRSLFQGTEQDERTAVLELLRSSDTGIEDVKFEDPDRGSATGRISRTRRIFLKHKSASVEEDGAWLPLEAESSGTIALMELAPRLTRAFALGSLLCVDEVEASLHPMLALSLLRLFHDRRRNPLGAQLVFTTHDTNLLGTTLGEPALRRDQVWFTEKDQEGSTHLYPLTDFHPRKQENLERGYLQGRYGAIPFLGELPVLTTDSPAAE